MGQIQAVANDTNGTALTLACTISASGTGNHLVAMISCSGDGGNIDNVSDNVNAGNWTKYTGFPGDNLTIFYKENTASGVTTVTATCLVTAREINMCVVERDDIPTSSSEASTPNELANGSGTTWTSNNSGTQSQAACVAYGWAYCVNIGSGIAPSGSWAAISGTNLTNGVNPNTGAGGESLYMSQVLSATTAIAATGTTSGAQIPQAAVAVFKQSATGPVLSSATVTSITATTAIPQVTITIS